MPQHPTHRRTSGRWQFSVTALLLVITVVAVAICAANGAFGQTVQGLTVWLAVMAMVMLAGIAYLVVIVLVLMSPVLLAGALLKWMHRLFRRATPGDITRSSSGPLSPTTWQPSDIAEPGIVWMDGGEPQTGD